jgi:hypothetical protein
LVGAQIVASTIQRYQRLLAKTHTQQQKRNKKKQQQKQQNHQEQHLALHVKWACLEEAWLPFHMGCKVLWWDTAVMSDELVGQLSPSEFREGVEALAADSLELLRAAFPVEQASTHPCSALFTLPVWASVMGMLNQNSMAIRVYSPVARYFQKVQEGDGLSGAEQSQAMSQLMPIAQVGMV